MNIKHLVVIFFLALCLAVMFFSCVDPVIGDSPIVILGDVCYVFVTNEDEVMLRHAGEGWRNTNYIRVWRAISGGAVVKWEEDIEFIEKIIISVDGRVYTFRSLACQGNDDCDYYQTFTLNDNTLSCEMDQMKGGD